VRAVRAVRAGGAGGRDACGRVVTGGGMHRGGSVGGLAALQWNCSAGMQLKSDHM
jgi:hypothetical protein